MGFNKRKQRKQKRSLNFLATNFTNLHELRHRQEGFFLIWTLVFPHLAARISSISRNYFLNWTNISFQLIATRRHAPDGKQHARHAPQRALAVVINPRKSTLRRKPWESSPKKLPLRFLCFLLLNFVSFPCPSQTHFWTE